MLGYPGIDVALNVSALAYLTHITCTAVVTLFLVNVAKSAWQSADWQLCWHADSTNMENVRQIFQALLLLRLDTDMAGYNQPEALMAVAQKVAS